MKLRRKGYLEYDLCKLEARFVRVLIPSLLVFKTQDDFSLLHIVQCTPFMILALATALNPALTWRAEEMTPVGISRLSDVALAGTAF